MEPQDRRFVESFKQYMDLLVEESCNEIRGWKPVPKEMFEEAGHKLLEASKSLEITREAEDFVGAFNDLAENRMLAPEPGAVCSTPSGNSLRKNMMRIYDFKEYFESIGLAMDVGEANFDGRPVMSACLGEADRIRLPNCPELILFTKMAIEPTHDTIVRKAKGRSDVSLSDWTHAGKVYHVLEPHLKNGELTLSSLKTYSELKLSSAKVNKAYVMREMDKLEELAWSALSLESGDKEGFAKKYAAVCIGDSYLHEIYHSEMDNESGSFDEAAAQLYSIFRGSNPIHRLRGLYFWKDTCLYTYSHAAEIAFKQLETAGYKESSWKELDPIDTEGVNAAGSEIRRLAGLALENLEEGLNWRSHKEAEKELGLERNYPKLHEELQKLGDVNYGK